MTEPHSFTCDDCQDRLAEFALDELSGDAKGAVARHLESGCELCNESLAQILAGFAALPHGLPAQLPPLRIERDLMQRIARPTFGDVPSEPASGEPAGLSRRDKPGGSPEASSPGTGSPAAVSKRPFTNGLLGAAIALAAGVVGIAAWIAWNNQFFGERPSAIVAESGRAEPGHWEALDRRVNRAELSQHFASIPRLEFAYLRSRVPEKPVHGYIVTDRVANQWHVYVFNLPALPAGRTYQLWFVAGDSRHVSAGTVKPDETGAANRVVDVSSDVPSIVGIAVSDEPTNGSDKPTGESFFRADISQEPN